MQQLATYLDAYDYDMEELDGRQQQIEYRSQAILRDPGLLSEAVGDVVYNSSTNHFYDHMIQKLSVANEREWEVIRHEFQQMMADIATKYAQGEIE